MILQAADEFTHWLALIAYLVHSCEQREPRMRRRLSLASHPQPTLYYPLLIPSTPYPPTLELNFHLLGI
jgi:hypothetical protein